MKMFPILATLVCIVHARFPQGRIVGGYEVSPSFKYPWIASLQHYKTHLCGGTWYSGDNIITAAHCVVGDASDWSALVHRHNLRLSSEEERGSSYPVSDRVIHPKYTEDESYDISVWKVYRHSADPDILLDTGDISNSDDTLLTIVGWGATYSGGSSASKLLKVKVPIFSITKCKSIYPDLDTVSQYCAGYPEGKKDSCQGDSGGPMFASKGNAFTLVGVVSWGKACARKGHPGVYTRISAVYDFIEENV